MIKIIIAPIISAALTILVILARNHWFPEPSHQVGYYFLSIILTGAILTVIFLIQLALRLKRPQRMPKASTARKEPNNRESYRLHYPDDQRPKIMVAQAGSKAGRRLQLEVLDMSEKGLSLTNNDLLGIGETVFGTILFPRGESLSVTGTVVHRGEVKLGVNLHCFIPHSVYMKEQRRLLAMDRGTEFVPVPRTPFRGHRIRILLSNRMNTCNRKLS